LAVLLFPLFLLFLLVLLLARLFFAFHTLLKFYSEDTL